MTDSIADLLPDVLFGIAPGAVLLAIGRCSSGSIGAADAVMLMFLGLIYGVGDCLRFLLIALFIGGAAAVMLIVFRRADRKSRMPFYPFLLTGFLLCRVAVMKA